MNDLEKQLKEAEKVVEDLKLAIRDECAYNTIRPSLDRALKLAHGSSEHLNKETLKQISAYELLCILGSNSIVFRYDII